MNRQFLSKILPIREQKQDSSQDMGLSGTDADWKNALPREESVLLLRKNALRLQKSPDSAVHTLAERLGDIPLSLYLAACYSNVSLRFSLDAYLAEIQKTAGSLPESLQEWAKTSAVPEAQNLAAAFLCSYRLLQQPLIGEKLAQPVLWAAGFCAPGAAIPLSVLKKSVITENGKHNGFQAPPKRLAELGILVWSENGPYLPLPFAEIARCLAQPDAAVLEKLSQALTAYAEEAVNTDPAKITPELIAHLETAAEYASRKEEASAASLWNMLGQCCWKVKDLEKAQAAFERALTIDEKVLGSQHPNTIAGISNLGRLLSDMGNNPAAKEYLQRALVLEEKSFSHESLNFAAYSASLGHVLHKLGDLFNAKFYLERALALHEKAYGIGPWHKDTANDLFNLGLVLADLGSWSAAKTNFEKSLAIHEWLYGKSHPSIAADLNQLGRTLRVLGEVNKAKDCFGRLIDLEKKLSGTDSNMDSFALNQLGLVLQDLNDLPGARSCFEQALAVDEQQYGEEHPYIGRDLNNLGCVLRDLGNLNLAQVCFRRALTINENTNGHNHRDIAINANNLGRVLYSLEDLKGAKDCFEKVLHIDEAFYGADHTEVAKAAVNLGTVLHELEDLDSARSNFERAISIFEKSLPSDHPKIIDARKNLERVKRQLERSA